jgi:hypothetical protein
MEKCKRRRTLRWWRVGPPSPPGLGASVVAPFVDILIDGKATVQVEWRDCGGTRFISSSPTTLPCLLISFTAYETFEAKYALALSSVHHHSTQSIPNRH